MGAPARLTDSTASISGLASQLYPLGTRNSRLLVQTSNDSAMAAGGDCEPHSPPRERDRVNQIVRESVLVAVETIGLTAVVVGVGRVWGWDVSPWGLAGLAATIALIGYVGRRLRHPRQRKPPGLEEVHLSRPFVRFALIRERLKAADRPDRFASLVQPLLAELAEDRLRRRHGIDWKRDPAQARTVLGDELWAVVNGGEVPSPTIETVDTLVNRIEHL